MRGPAQHQPPDQQRARRSGRTQGFRRLAEPGLQTSATSDDFSDGVHQSLPTNEMTEEILFKLPRRPGGCNVDFDGLGSNATPLSGPRYRGQTPARSGTPDHSEIVLITSRRHDRCPQNLSRPVRASVQPSADVRIVAIRAGRHASKSGHVIMSLSRSPVEVQCTRRGAGPALKRISSVISLVGSDW